MIGDEVLRIHTDVFYGSLKSQDYAALEQLYSDDYMLVRPDGAVLNKQEVLHDLRANGLTFHSIDPGEITVRIYGSTAVVTGETRTARHGRVSRVARIFDLSPSIRAWAIPHGWFIFKVTLSLGKPAVSVAGTLGT